jgi:nucleotide-binding universal stress UspA family protein
MSNKVLVGIDGSPNAAAALAWALVDARARRVPIEAVYVFYEPSFVYGTPGYVPLSEAEVDGLGRDVLDAALSTIANPGDVKIDLRTTMGFPVDVLAQATEEDDVEMVVIGARGKGGVAGLLLGSVSHAMTHRSRKPLAIIPADWKADDSGEPSERRILVGVDGSEESERALAWAIADASARGVSVEAVTAWSSKRWRHDADESAEALSMLRESVGKVDPSGVDVRSTVLHGEPAEVLVDQALQAEFLVVGSRGRGRAREALWGSVSHAVTHRAAVPVVVVPSS